MQTTTSITLYFALFYSSVVSDLEFYYRWMREKANESEDVISVLVVDIGIWRSVYAIQDHL